MQRHLYLSPVEPGTLPLLPLRRFRNFRQLIQAVFLVGIHTSLIHDMPKKISAPADDADLPCHNDENATSGWMMLDFHSSSAGKPTTEAPLLGGLNVFCVNAVFTKQAALPN